ncbi:hypothetical protein AVEN_124944-1, partial [Araneus ventricosus]
MRLVFVLLQIRRFTATIQVGKASIFLNDISVGVFDRYRSLWWEGESGPLKGLCSSCRCDEENVGKLNAYQKSDGERDGRPPRDFNTFNGWLVSSAVILTGVLLKVGSIVVRRSISQQYVTER